MAGEELWKPLPDLTEFRTSNVNMQLSSLVNERNTVMSTILTSAEQSAW